MNKTIGRDWEIIERDIFTPEEIAKAEHKASIISKQLKLKLKTNAHKKAT